MPIFYKTKPASKNGRHAPLRGRVPDRRNRLSHLLQNELAFERLAHLYKTNSGRRLASWVRIAGESTGETACRTFYKTNYAATAVMAFSFASTGWRRDWSFRSWFRLTWKFFVTLCS